MSVEAAVETPLPSEPPRERPGLEKLIKVGAVTVSVLATIFSAMLELFLTPLRIGGVPIGVAVLAAVVANLALCWFVMSTVGQRWALAPPWAVWTLIMFYAAGVRTTEGDYLLSGDNWVALVMILVGSLTFAVYTYRAILKGPAVTKQ